MRHVKVTYLKCYKLYAISFIIESSLLLVEQLSNPRIRVDKN